MTPFRRLRRVDGYPLIEDHGVVGDGTTAALVCRDGAVNWLCVPRFDSPPIFCALLDAARGGAFTVAPEGVVESRQYYEEDTCVLVTELRTPDAVVRLTDALPLRAGADLREDAAAGREELVRSVRVLRGDVRLRVGIEPYGGAEAESRAGGLDIRCGDGRRLHLMSTLPLQGLRSVLGLRAGEELVLVLGWRGGQRPLPGRDAAALLDATRAGWRRWAGGIRYEGPQQPLVRRSVMTLKLLDHFATGAVVAAPTSSLPETIGGARNWDYRYAWIRDAAFSVYALHRVGASLEARGFLAWVLAVVDRAERPRVLYDLDGAQPGREREDPLLEGYRGSRPVRWGNAAGAQRQHDVYGEVLDCAYQWGIYHGRLDEGIWERLVEFIEAARREWRDPDQGIWEVRTPGRTFTYSAALCHVALDRGARLVERFALPGDAAGWRAAAETIRRAILDEAWDPRAGSLTEHLGGGGLDASLLALSLRRVLAPDDARMVATTEAIRRRLGAGKGLLYRYLPDESPDGLPGHEGAFLLCSFWLVDNLAWQGRLDEAMELFDSLCARANPLGLLPEQVDPSSGEFLGNFPQAFSHVGLVSSGVNLARAVRRRP
jgi:GH15 family glucan-1,4-alpha-glucosidase